jgi:hypothetical protein
MTALARSGRTPKRPRRLSAKSQDRLHLTLDNLQNSPLMLSTLSARP